MATDYKVERSISAIFSTEEQVNRVIHRLLDRNISRDHLSVMGRNFQTETRISGFLTKRDVIISGLKSGAIFGSLFGSFLALLSGVGVLFIPFIGPVVAAGPLGAILLGATSGALAGSAGAGLVSVLMAYGMPEEKATLYQTRLKAGDFMVVAETSADRTGEIQILLESEGGEEIHINQQALPLPCPSNCESIDDLSPEIRSHLSREAQQEFMSHYNTVLKQSDDAIKAEEAAWDYIRERYAEDENGVWSRVKVMA